MDGLRRKDTTKGPPLRILSLDGGGVRGYSMLIILQELMHLTFVEMEGRAPRRNEIPKPCDHFDLIAGTGTGGLIAIMLGRLRLDLDTCKDLYVRLTRRAFESDKTLLGVPLRGTMFKATKLEEVIKECVRDHTIFEDEGNDSLANATPMTPDTPQSVISPSSPGFPQRSMSQSSRYSQIGRTSINNRISLSSLRFGNPNALLYDTRENRTKTAVTAVLRGTPVTTMLRSYDSRKEPAPDVNCKIWEAARATAAIQMAFKPIQIGQSVYLDDGSGRFNPSPQVLDEAVQNEWPGREVGVFVSIGTGRRPPSTGGNSHEWWEGFLGGSMGDFADARRKLIAKLEACEDIHKFMLREHLSTRGVTADNYFRLNVEVGVGEFGMNEWNRLSDISTNTRLYLSRDDVKKQSQSAARKLGAAHLTRARHDRAEARQRPETGNQQYGRHEWQHNSNNARPPSNPTAVELPGDEGPRPGQQYEHRGSIADQKYTVVAPDTQYMHRPSVADQKYTVVSSDGFNQPVQGHISPYQQSPKLQAARPHQDYSQDYRRSLNSFQDSSPRVSGDFHSPPNSSPPPLPPKTPVSGGGLPYPDQSNDAGSQPKGMESGTTRTFMNMGDLSRRLPYPDGEEPPPPVNTSNKPQISR